MGVDQLDTGGKELNIDMAEQLAYAGNVDPGATGTYSKVIDGSETNVDGALDVIQLSDQQRHSPAPQEDILTVQDPTYGATTTHTWYMPEPDFGQPGNNGPEVERIVIEYENCSFDGLTDADVDIRMVRTLSGELDESDIGVNSGDYSGQKATIETSGFAQRDAAGPIRVTINGITNGNRPGTATMTLQGGAPDYTKQGLFPEAEPYPVAPQFGKTVFADIGFGDSTVIRTIDNKTMLVDTSDGGLIPRITLDELRIDRLDHLVITHAHADHVGGATELIQDFEDNRDGVGTVWDLGKTTGSQLYANFIDTVNNYGLPYNNPRQGDTIPLSGATVEVFNPPAGNLFDGQNNNSLVLKVTFPQTGGTMIVGGDAEAEAETAMVNNTAVNLDSDALQVNHHGSTTSSTTAFLDAVSPQISVFSSELDNQFGHPADSILDKFSSRGETSYWTAVHGNVSFTTTDPTTTETEESFSTDAADFKSEKI